MEKSLMRSRESDNQLNTDGGWNHDRIEITVRHVAMIERQSI